METSKFNEIVAIRINELKSTLIDKAEEYARGDRLSNFKQMGNLLHITPEKALLHLVTKHYVALCDFVNDIDEGTVQASSRWDERLGNIIAYMVLLDALITERHVRAAGRGATNEPGK